MSQRKHFTVLLVEADTLLRRIITLGLQQRGMHVIEASSRDISSLNTAQPDLLVLDIDSNIHTNWSLIETVRTHPRLSQLPVVVVAWECPAEVSQRQVSVLTQLTYVAKPFDARTLYDTVEQLLLAYTAQKNAYISQAEEALLATYSARTSLSIWPIITAAGLLLAFAGMMLQITVTGIGLLVIMVALTLWALEKKPEQGAVVMA